MTTDLRFAVIGHGSIGKRHAANLRFLGYNVVTVDPSVEADVKHVDEVGKVDGVIVATPAAWQVPVAWRAVMERQPVFVEKPAGRTADELALLHQAQTIVQIGFNLRFDQSLLAFRERLHEVGAIRWARVEFGQHISAWRPGRDYKDTPAADGILLEASHEIDLINWLFGPVERVVGAHIESRTKGIRDDNVSAVLRTTTGVTVELHLDMLRHGYRREITVCGEDATRTWTPDWVGPAGTVVHGVNRMYLRELEHFVSCITNATQPVVGVAEAIAAHRLISKIRAADPAEVEGYVLGLGLMQPL